MDSALVSDLLPALWSAGVLPSIIEQTEREQEFVLRCAATRRFAASLNDDATIRQWQRARLAELVDYATRCCPFYERLYQGRSVPQPIDPSDLPLVLRSDVAERWEQMISGEFSGRTCDRKRTSGTTGEPVTIVQSEEESYRTLVYALARVIDIAGPAADKGCASPYVTAVTDNPSHPRFATYNALMKKWCEFEVVDPLDLSTVDTVLARLAERRPAVLLSRPSALGLLAERLPSGPAPLPEAGIAVSSGANLYPDHRARISSILGVPVLDLYALSECSGVASQCSPEGDYHVHWEQAMVEVIDPTTLRPAHEDEFGEVVVTDLSRRAMPIVRYRTGDSARWAEGHCRCGRAGPRLASIVGRDAPYFTLPDGRRFNPSALNRALANIDGLTQFRITQETSGGLTVEYVSEPGHQDVLQAGVADAIRGSLATPVEITFVSRDTLGNRRGKVQRYARRAAPGVG